jgi:hypothetical protein
VSITRAVDAHGLTWPTSQERRSETLGGNHDYAPLGRLRWTEVREHIDCERSVIDRIAAADDAEECHAEWLEECAEDLCMLGFDLGTNALSAALAAARCLPFYACNGGAFDDGHHDSYPLVAFFCRAEVFPFVWTLLNAPVPGSSTITLEGSRPSGVMSMLCSAWRSRCSPRGRRSTE